MFVLALSLYNTWNRGVFLLCKITNLLIYSIHNIFPSQFPICTSNHFLHSITASYYSAINFSTQVPLTIINWSAPFHPCVTGKSDLIVAVILLHTCYISTNFHHVSGRLTESKKKNPRTEVLRFVISLNCNSLAR